MRVFKGLLTRAECKKLNVLALGYLESGVLLQNGSEGRYTTRCVDEDFKFDGFVYEISNRIREAAGVQKYKLEKGKGSNGVGLAVTLNNGYLKLHVDPRSLEGFVTYRCNVFSQKSDAGGELVIYDKVADLDIGDVHCFAASEEPHIVMPSKGTTPRILWMFGAHIPVADWESEKIKGSL